MRIHWANFTHLTLTPVASIVLGILYFQNRTPSWGLLVFFAFYTIVCSLCITAGYHRYFSHRSFKANRLVELFFILVGAAPFQGPLLQWVKDHRRHHRKVDTDEDPYNIRRGFFFAHMGWLLEREDPRYLGQDPPDLSQDPVIRFQSRYYVPLAFVMGYGFPALVGWFLGDVFGGILFGGLFRIVLTNHSTFLVNSLAHTWGRRPYNQVMSARDSLLMAVLAYGEGYHNFHHEFASDYRNGIRWYHWDPTKWWIQSLSWIGFSWNLRVTPASEILSARLSIDQQTLLQKGISQEMVDSLKRKILEAQEKWRTLCSDYLERKRSWSEGSKEKLGWIREEVREAKNEFKRSRQLWIYYLKTRRVPVVGAA